MELETEISAGVVRVRGHASALEAAQYVAALAGMQGGLQVGAPEPVQGVEETQGVEEVAPAPRLFALAAATDPPAPAPPASTSTTEPTATMVFELPRRHAQAVEETGLRLTTIASVKEFATGPGFRVRLVMDSEGAVKLYEALAEAIKTTKLPGLYTTRRELQHALDAHFGIHGEAG